MGKKIGIVTYVTDNIIDYSAYSLSINAIYAHLHDYPHRILSPHDGSEYDSHDQRWNKVRILYEALTSVSHDEDEDEGDASNRSSLNSWAKEMDYVVWMDADLIVLNMFLTLESIIASYPHNNILISKDPSPQEIYR